MDSRNTLLAQGALCLSAASKRSWETAASSDEAYQWLRAHIMPLLRQAQSHWPRVGFVFGMAGPRNLFRLNEGDGLVYFGRSKDRSKSVRITLGMWNGVATGEGAYRIMTTGSKRETGGYHAAPHLLSW